MLSGLINKKMALKMLMLRFGISKEYFDSMVDRATSIFPDVVPANGVQPGVLSLLVSKYRPWLEPERAKLTAALAVKFLPQIDPEGKLMPVFSFLNTLPVGSLGDDYDSYEDFFSEALFPSILQLLPASASCDDCGSTDGEVVPTRDGPVFFCNKCGGL